MKRSRSSKSLVTGLKKPRRTGLSQKDLDVGAGIGTDDDYALDADVYAPVRPRSKSSGERDRDHIGTLRDSIKANASAWQHSKPLVAAAGHAVFERPAAATARDFVSPGDFLKCDSSAAMRALMETAGLFDPAAAPPAGGHGLREAGALPPPTHRDAYIELRPRTALWTSQLEAVAFMRDREQQRVLGTGGGLICDEMGQGKTLQVLAFLLERLQDLCRRKGSPYGEPTLVVLPKTLVLQWRDEIRKHFPSAAFSTLFMNEATSQSATRDKIMHHYNLVVTTYATVTTAFNSRKPGARRKSLYAVLFDVPWERIIADEGHVFSNRETTRFEAMCGLRAHHKWILTGTPFLNDVHNLCAELMFVGVHPEHLPDITTARSERVTGTIAAVRSEERQRSLYSETGSYAYMLRLRDVLGRVMLRRIGQSKRYTRRVALADFETTAERDLYDFYNQRFRETCRALQENREARASSLLREDDGADEGDNDEDAEEEEHLIESLMEVEADELEEGELRPVATAVPTVAVRRMVTVDILRLRQICIAPVVIRNIELPAHLLLDAGFAAPLRLKYNTQARIAAHAPGAPAVPSLAYLAATRLLTTRSPFGMHVDTPETDLQWLRTQRPTGVKSNAEHRRLKEVVASVRARILPSIGTKIRMFLRHFHEEIPADDKYLIFSDWVMVLENIRRAFEASGTRCLIMTGKQRSEERMRVLSDFKTAPDARVLLMSLHVGANGLNIECANHVSQGAPWWNPHAEDQAVFRVVRPGQTKHSFVFNIVMRGTVEEDVTRMAQEKQYISRILVENDADTLALVQDMDRAVAASRSVAGGEAPSAERLATLLKRKQPRAMTMLIQKALEEDADVCL